MRGPQTAGAAVMGSFTFFASFFSNSALLGCDLLPQAALLVANSHIPKGPLPESYQGFDVAACPTNHSASGAICVIASLKHPTLQNPLGSAAHSGKLISPY